MTAPDFNPGGDYVSRDKIIYGDEVHGNIVYQRSQREELRDYLAAAVPRYAWKQKERVHHAQSQQIAREPYKFLASFDLEDTNFFFGRTAAVESLYELVTTNRLTVLHAKSGAGKTSLLNAGLAPRLIATGRIPIYARAFQDPVQAIKRAIATSSGGPWPDLLHKLTLWEFLSLVCRHLISREQELVLVLDQFEEFFIFWPLLAQRQPFIDDFVQCYHDADLPVRFIYSLRKDYYSDLADFEPYIPAIFGGQLRLDAMERAQAAEAITTPVSRLKRPVSYAPDLLDALLDDLGGSGMELPHMQIVCRKLYDDVRKVGAQLIDLPTYEHLGRAPRILQDYLKGKLERYPGRGAAVGKAILKELVSSEVTKRTLPYSILVSRVEATPFELQRTFARLVRDRLLRRHEVEGEIVYEMAHEYLIAEIKEWIDTSDLAFKQVEELLYREVTNWRIHHTLIPRDRLELIYTQRARLGHIDGTTGECLLRSAVQSNFAIEEWLHFVAHSTIQPLFVVLGDTTLDSINIDARGAAAEALGQQGNPHVVKPLIVALKDGNERVSKAAADALEQLGDLAVEQLIAALRDADVGPAAAHELWRLGDARAVEPLIVCLKEEEIGKAAARALGQLGGAAVEPLIAALKDPSWAVRRAAAEVLGQLGATAVVPLITALNYEDPRVRRAAAQALRQLGDVAVEPLIAALKDVNVGTAAAKVLRQLGAAAVGPLITALKDANVSMAAAELLGQLGDAAVGPLITALKDAGVRTTAAHVLTQLGDAALDPLVAALNDEDWQMRSAVAAALGSLGDDRAVKSLITALKDANDDVRAAAAEALGQLGDTAIVPLIAALDDKDWQLRSAVAEALGKLCDARAVAPLMAALKDGNEGVRVAAVKALGQLGDVRAVGPLIAALKDGNEGVRTASAEALGRLGAPAVKPLMTAVKGADGDLRRAAAEALGKLGNAAVEPLIIELKDADEHVRRAAVDALGNLGDPRAVAPIIAVLQNSSWAVRRVAAEALGKLGDTRAVAPLIGILKNSDGELRRAVAEVLGKLGDAQAVMPLIATLEDVHADVRKAAVDALGRLSDARAVGPLIIALKDADEHVRRATVDALGQIGDARAVEPLVTALKDWDRQAGQTVVEALRAIGTPKALIALKTIRQ